MNSFTENNKLKSTTNDSSSGQLSFSDWKKLKNSLSPNETSNTPSNYPERRPQNNYNNRTTQKTYVPPLMPPPSIPPLLQSNLYIKPLMATMVPAPDPDTSPLIPQLAPFVMARNQRRFNSMQSSSFNKSLNRPQQRPQRPTTRQSGKNYTAPPMQQKPKAPSEQKKPEETSEVHNQISKPTEVPLISEDNVTNALIEKARQPQIFVRKPQLNKGKKEKIWIPKPSLPPPIIATTPELREEKQRLWREYRQAMKPFKCREFANAKRTVQRLSKKNKDEMDEKELARLQKAEETIADHKAMLSKRAAMRSIKIQDQVRAEQEGREKVTGGNGNFNATNMQGNANKGYIGGNQYQNNVHGVQGYNNNKSSQYQGNEKIKVADIRTRYNNGSFVSAGFWNPSTGVISK